MEVSVTTSKIISEDEKKDEEMRFLRQVGHWEGGKAGFFVVFVPLGQGKEGFSSRCSKAVTKGGLLWLALASGDD